MLARLIEAWTDSVSERAYQAPFCQMLVHQGHRILHNTRHSALEFGKDIVSVDPNGVPCAYQLKGHPGRRLTKSDYAASLTQIHELVYQPILYPGVPQTRHRAYLVTNGEVEEEVQVAVSSLSQNLGLNVAASSLELISRGTFIRWGVDLAEGLWPTGMADLTVLFSLLAKSGLGSVPLEQLDQMLRSTLGLTEESVQKTPSDAEIERRIASASLLVPVALRNFSLRENHWAIATGWCMYAAYAVSAAERFGLQSKRLEQFVDIAERAAADALRVFAREIVSRGKVGPVSFAEVAYFRTRHTLLCSIVALVWFFDQQGEAEDELARDIEGYLREHGDEIELWGEAAIPQILMVIWCLAEIDPTPRSDGILASLLNAAVTRSINPSSAALYGVHYDAETVLTHVHADILRPASDPLEGEDTHPPSSFAEALLQIAARRNLKRTCKAIWNKYSHLQLRRFEPPERWQTCLYRTEKGAEFVYRPPKRESWPHLVEQAHGPAKDLLDEFQERPILLAMFALIFPHRATTGVIRILADNFHSSWALGGGRLTRR